MPWRHYVPVFAAAAAVILVAAVGAWLVVLRTTSQRLALSFPADLQQFAQTAEVPGDFAKLAAALAGNGLYVTLKPPAAGGPHQVVPLGMRLQRLNGQPVAQLFFSCCGQPMCVFVAHKEYLTVAHLPTATLPDGCHVLTHDLDRYRVLVVGPHDPAEILRLFS